MSDDVRISPTSTIGSSLFALAGIDPSLLLAGPCLWFILVPRLSQEAMPGYMAVRVSCAVVADDLAG